MIFLEDLFYQFYDLLLIAVTAVIIYISVRNGISKTFLLIIGYALSIFIAFQINGATATFLYSKFFQEKNIQHIYDNISEMNFSRQYKAYIDSLGYNFTADSEKLEEIFKSGEDITEKTFQYFSSIQKNFDSEENFSQKFRTGYKQILFDSIKSDIPSFVIESPEFSKNEFDESIKMMYNDYTMRNAVYIEEHFTRKPAVSFIEKILFVLTATAVMLLITAINDRISGFVPSFGIADHILGIVSGIAETAFSFIIISVSVKILIDAGNNEMILFNTDTIEKTRIFRHIYNIIIKNTVD